MMKKQLLSLLVLLGCAASPVAAQQSGESDSQKKQRMEWFSDAKLGVFIHWGVYAVNGVAESWSFFNKYLPYEEYMDQKNR